jgi:hypothetical protein
MTFNLDIINVITSYLQPKDIKTCMCLSQYEYKKWYQFMPRIYSKNINIIPNIKYIVKNCTKEILFDIIQNLHLNINVVDITFSSEYQGEIFNNIDKIFRNLQSLTFDQTKYSKNISIESINNILEISPNLQTLKLGYSFNNNKIFTRYNFRNLRIISFSDNFNESIRSLCNLINLTSIHFSTYSKFNQNIDETFINGFNKLNSIVFGSSFNQNINSLQNVKSLQLLHFGYSFNQNIDNIFIYPYFENLETLIFGWDFNQNIDKVFTSGLNKLNKLSFGYSFNKSIESISNLINLTEFYFGNTQSNLFDGSYEPLKVLKKLNCNCNYDYYINKRKYKSNKINPL